ncbi:Aste57867_15880 [Aphanomyces stellatus]|uniref:Aste57867_15880 protein n=1 Tax=Aphanomyces stellatus TaxID=120398 RepID=A0A485L615_9STRA|nr:hypothetical protein As57867_015824 [Aphanomyces stellatus]VFT92667.1 Aste57867_15880 [Aphanomyces stellatus]
MSLSTRGKRALQPALSYFQKALDALPHEATDDNLDGYVIVAISENRILDAPKMLAKLNKSCATVGKSALGYDDFTGRRGFKEAYAAFVKATLLQNTPKTINPSHLALSSGVGSLLAHLSSLLHDDGDAVLLPTPAYGAIYNDFNVSAGTVVVDVPMSTNYDISPTELQVGYERALAQGHTPKSVLLLNPENPLGIMRSAATLRAISQWCLDRHLHLIVDEIYANSVHSPELSPHPFTTAALALVDEHASSPSSEYLNLPPHVHVLWGLSKDWAASGLRVGVVLTANPDLMQALSNVLYFSGVPNYLLDGLATLLRDLPWTLDFIAANNRDLRASYATVAAVLDAHAVPYVPSPAGMFIWVDFSAFLGAPTWAAERALTDTMHRECKFIMTPGEAQHARAPGFFRICFAYNTPTAVAHGLERTLRYLTTSRRN